MKHYRDFSLVYGLFGKFLPHMYDAGSLADLLVNYERLEISKIGILGQEFGHALISLGGDFRFKRDIYARNRVAGFIEDKTGKLPVFVPNNPVVIHPSHYQTLASSSSAIVKDIRLACNVQYQLRLSSIFVEDQSIERSPPPSNGRRQWM